MSERGANPFEPIPAPVMWPGGEWAPINPELWRDLFKHAMSNGGPFNRLHQISEALTVKGTDPLFPVDERINERGTVVQRANTGCTLRTHAAIQIMAAIASDPAYDAGPDEAADTAVKWTDALIARLNK